MTNRPSSFLWLTTKFFLALYYNKLQKLRKFMYPERYTSDTFSMSDIFVQKEQDPSQEFQSMSASFFFGHVDRYILTSCSISSFQNGFTILSRFFFALTCLKVSLKSKKKCCDRNKGRKMKKDAYYHYLCSRAKVLWIG